MRQALSGLFLMFVCLVVFGCGDHRSHVLTVPVPAPENLNAQQLAAWNYAQVAAPVTSSTPHSTPTWIAGTILEYSAGPIHPSVRLTRSVLRPGQLNTPAQRILEEVVLTRCEDDPAVPPATYGAPPGWQVVAMIGHPAIGSYQEPAVDQNGNTVMATRLRLANGLADVFRKVIWCQSWDDAVTPEGQPLMRALDHEYRHAWVYELALRRGLQPADAARESKAIDPVACAAASCSAP